MNAAQNRNLVAKAIKEARRAEDREVALGNSVKVKCLDHKLRLAWKRVARAYDRHLADRHVPYLGSWCSATPEWVKERIERFSFEA